MKQAIQTQTAPAAIGSYSQAIKTGNTVYLSGQIPLDPQSMEIVAGGLEAQIERVFQNLKNVAEAAGGSLNDIVRLTVYLLDISKLGMVNEVMTKFFKTPFPARTSIGVVALPKGAQVEVDAIMILSN